MSGYYLHGHINGLSFQWRFANDCDFDRFLKLTCSLITMSLINRPRQMRLVPLLDRAGSYEYDPLSNMNMRKVRSLACNVYGKRNLLQLH